MLELPIDSVIPEIITRLRERRAMVVVAPPGAGKTTRVPPAVLRAGLLHVEQPRLVLLQPRRVAARAVAQRMADENAWELGREIGYHIRFEKRISSQTRLAVMTEGVLTRQLVEDPFLPGVGAVILDEFHERSIHTDLAIAMLREIQQTVRPDLLLMVMSATLAAEPVSRFLGDAPIVRSEGRLFPVDIQHHPATHKELAAAVVREVHESGDDGDILVFLPGVEEIRRCERALTADRPRDGLLVLALHGSLSADEQFAALRPAPHGRRKVILATNIAETSLTIEGVRTVIDSGLARVAGYDPLRGMDRLELKRISLASAKQRAGRAGRTGPGRCIRLYSASEERAMRQFEVPEIHRVDLCSTILSVHAFGHAEPRKFGWYEPPEEQSLASAERLLAMLGALTSETGGKLTAIGETLLALPVHPRLGRLMIEATDRGMLDDGATIAAVLSEKDVMRDQNVPYRERHAKHRADSDLIVRLEMLNGSDEVDQSAVRNVLRVKEQLLRVARRLPSPRPSPGVPGEGEIGEILRLPLYAYPDRVCRRRSSDRNAAAMVGGGGVRLAPESAVHDAEFFLALDARHDERNPNREAMARIASAIQPEWLEESFPQSIRRERVMVFDEQRQRVVARGTTYYRDLAIREDSDAPVDPQRAGEVLAEALRPRARELFENDEHAQALMNRVALLREHMPEHPWPKWDDADLEDFLAEAARGKRSLDDIKSTGLVNLLRQQLAWPLDRLLDEHAPETIAVPSGSRMRISYEGAGKPPVLAARLQELFGWTSTPRIAGGRVPLLIHLLAPNFRPVQVTSDLASFWRTTYFQVRKDLRVRYPKHAWPEDPLTAKAEAKGARRR